MNGPVCENTAVGLPRASLPARHRLLRWCEHVDPMCAALGRTRTVPSGVATHTRVGLWVCVDRKRPNAEGARPGWARVSLRLGSRADPLSRRLEAWIDQLAKLRLGETS